MRDELRSHGRCEIPRYDEESPGRLRADCFPDRRLRIGDFAFQFGANE